MNARAMMLFLTLLSGVIFAQDANAQNYCARFYDDTQTCGIPTLRDCERTVSGVGGDCIPDDTAEIPQGRSLQGPLRRLLEGSGNKPSSPELDDVPPPPGN